MPTQSLPRDPSLENLKKQAKTLHKKAAGGDVESLRLVEEFYPGGVEKGFSLSDAQLVIARRHGFASWAKLREQVEIVERYSRSPHVEPQVNADTAEGRAELYLRLGCLTYGKDHASRQEKARELLLRHPEMVGMSLYTACAAGDRAMVEGMLKNDATAAVRAGGPHRWEPLLYACYSRAGIKGADWVGVVRALLAHGADANAGYLWEGTYGFTALTGVFGEGEAGKGNQPEHPQCMALARVLLEAGADANDAQVLYNRHFEAGNEHLKLLLEFGLGKGSGGVWKDRMGPMSQTPAELVHEQVAMATMNYNTQRVKLLVEHGGEFKTPDKGGRTKGLTPLEMALTIGNREVAEYLVSKGAPTPELSDAAMFSGACLAGDEKQARSRLASDPGLMEKLGAHGRWVLMERAAGFNRMDGMRLLIKLGFAVNWPGKASPLHSAAWAGHVEMAKLLVSQGADLEAKDPTYNARPVDWAKYSHKAEMVKYLEGVMKPDHG